jgi:hypothetical protein
VAASGKTLVVQGELTNASAVQGTYPNLLANFAGLMKQRGGTFSLVPARATRTLWMATGLQVWGPQNNTLSSTEQFDAVVVLGFARTTTFPTGCTPCSLAMAGVTASHVGWPTVPVVIFGEPGIGASKWTATSTCSTGVTSNAGAYSSVKRTYVAYPVGSTNVWKSLSISLWPVTPITQPAGITLRRVVAMGYTSVTPGGAPAVSSILRTDADSTGFTSASNDSVILWALYKSGSNIPVIFVDTGSSAGQDVGLMAMAMQMADSASGGNVWDAGDAKPIQAALAVTATTSRGKYTTGLDANAATAMMGGPFCYADSCDTTNVLGGLDSLGTLGGLKTTFYVDPCSLSHPISGGQGYSSVKNWFYRAGKYRVGLQPMTGTNGFSQNAGIKSADTLWAIDPLGRVRQRTVLPATVGTIPGQCYYGGTADSGSVYCGVRWAFDKMADVFGRDLIDRSILPAMSDWSPVAYTRAGGGPGRDSVAWALWHAGVRSIIIRPEWINTNPSVSALYYNSTATYYPIGGVNPGADPYGFGPETGNIPVYADPANPGRVIGKIKIVAERGQRAGPNVSYTDPVHDIRNEWFEGLVQEQWYFAPIQYYYHNFRTRTQILTVSLGQLGGHGVTAGAIGTGPARIGWWMIKHTHNQFVAANNLGWVDTNGRQRHMFDWAFVEDIEP